MIAAHHESVQTYLRIVYPHWFQAPLRVVLNLGLKARQRAEIAAARKPH